MLTSVEAFWLRWHADHGAPPAAQRARILLLAAQGAPAEAIAEALSVPPAEAVAAVGQFARRRLADFPRPALGLDDLLAAARVDRAHAAHVADLAVALFDFTRSLHRLPIGLRRVIEAAGLLHNVGLELDADRHHTLGRDLLRAADLLGFPSRAQALIACAVGFHRKRARAADDPGFAALPRAQQRQALALSALLRVADGLDYSHTQSTELRGVIIRPEGVTLRLAGPEAARDGRRAAKKADLWQEVFHLPLATALEGQAAPDFAALAALPLSGKTPLSDAARRALAIHLARWQAYEAFALAGETDAIRVVRVSVRRLRAALVVFRSAFKKKPAKRVRTALLEMEDVLGRLRDLDVLLADARAYHTRMAQRAGAGHVAALIAAWEKSRARALADAEAWLTSPAALDLQTSVAAFSAAPPLRADQPLAAGAGPLLRSLLIEAVELERRLSSDKPKSYHRLRLAFKNLRYAVQFLLPALAPEAEELAADLGRVQAALGALNDTRLLETEVARYLDAHAERQAQRKAPQLQGAQGVLEYAEAQRAQWTEQVRQAEAALGPVRPTRLRQRVAAALAPLKLNSARSRRRPAQ